MQKITKTKYYKTEREFYENLKRELGKKLLFYCPTGSIARKEIIPGWSDIDVVIVFNEWNKDVFSSIDKSLAKNKSGIKIGITFYSLAEFNSYKFQDPKTFNIIYNIKTGRYSPTVHDPSVKLNNCRADTFEIIKMVEFNKTLHNYKRELLLYPKFNERVAYKELILMVRILLMKKNVITDGYKEVLEASSKLLKDLPFPRITPQEIMKHPESAGDRYIGYINFLSWLEKNA